MKIRHFITDDLTSKIKEDPDIVRDFNFCGVKTIGAFLNEVLVRKGCTISQLILKSGLSKPYVYQILSEQRSPSRDTVIRIAIALELTADELQRALMLSGKAQLYVKIRRDAAIMACLVKRFTLHETEGFLLEIGEASLS